MPVPIALPVGHRPPGWLPFIAFLESVIGIEIDPGVPCWLAPALIPARAVNPLSCHAASGCADRGGDPDFDLDGSRD